MANYAMINGNIVENIIVVDNKEETENVLQCTLIEITPERPLGIGWVFIDDEWMPPLIETDGVIEN